MSYAVAKIIKNIYRPDIQVTFKLYGHFRCLQVLCSKWNYICCTVFFKAPWKLWNPLRKAVYNKFHGPGGHSKCNCLKERANCHRCQAWLIVLIFNTGFFLTCAIAMLWIYLITHLKKCSLRMKYNVLTCNSVLRLKCFEHKIYMISKQSTSFFNASYKNIKLAQHSSFNAIENMCWIIPSLNEVEEGTNTGFTLSICPSVHLWTESCLLCIFHNTQGIHFIFTHLIKHLQKVCHV